MGNMIILENDIKNILNQILNEEISKVKREDYNRVQFKIEELQNSLTETMKEFGKFTLEYKPPTETPEDHSVSMTISAEANIQQMLEFFSSFMRAAGYEFEGKEMCLERTAPDFGDTPEKWGADPGYFSCYPDGTPYSVNGIG